MAAHVEGQADAARGRDLPRPVEIPFLAASLAMDEQDARHLRRGAGHRRGEPVLAHMDFDVLMQGLHAELIVAYLSSGPVAGSSPR